MSSLAAITEPAGQQGSEGDLCLERFLPQGLNALVEAWSQGLAQTYRDRLGLSIPRGVQPR